jgi:DeoR/GlpR family transcriptional regulator of sugar metabolism
MNVLKRHEAIMALLIERREVTVAELSERLQVTGKTIREDLAKLEERGLLTRVRGGAVLAQREQLGILPERGPVKRHLAEKAEIAAAALELIEPGDTIALDGGSTTLELARRLPNAPLTVVTNDVFIISELAFKPEIRLVVPGGSRVRNVLTGPEAVRFVRGLNLRKAFLSSTGVHDAYGFSIYTGELVEYKRALIETAMHRYVLADRHKFGRVALRTFAALADVDRLITDSGLDAETEARYAAAGARIVKASGEARESAAVSEANPRHESEGLSK